MLPLGYCYQFGPNAQLSLVNQSGNFTTQLMLPIQLGSKFVILYGFYCTNTFQVVV